MGSNTFSVSTFIIATFLLSGFTFTTTSDIKPENLTDITVSKLNLSINHQGNSKGQKGKKNKNKDDRKRFHPFNDLKVPPGHLPPPGKCKIWLPNTPPGHQPTAQSCTSALRNVPLGAWVINHEGDYYKVNIFNRKRRNIIDEVRYFELQ
jgi:hypothetical protein